MAILGPTEIVGPAANRILPGPKVPGSLAAARAAFMSGAARAILIDPSDLDTLFQDTAGLVPITSGDVGAPVARIVEKSGLGAVGLQADPLRRMTYQTDGTLHWLETGADTDSDDYKYYDFTFPLASLPRSVSIACRVTGGSSRRTLIQGFGETTNPWHPVSAEIDGSDYWSAAQLISDAAVTLNVDAVYSARYDYGATGGKDLRVNGAVVASTTGGPTIGSNAALGVRLFCARTGVNRTQGRLYGLGFAQRYATPAEMLLMDTLMARLAGVDFDV